MRVLPPPADGLVPNLRTRLLSPFGLVREGPHRRGNSVTNVFAMNLVAAGLSLGATIAVAGALGAAAYGRVALALATLSFLSFVFDFGYFSAGARLLAVSEAPDRRRRLAGGMTVVFAAVSVLYVLVVLAVAPLAGRWLAGDIGALLVPAAPLSFALLLPFFLEQVCKGTGRMALFARWQVLSRALFAGGVAALVVADQVTVYRAIVVNLAAGLAALVVAGDLRPDFGDVAGSLRSIRSEHRRFGRALYVGRMANLTTYRTDSLLLGSFHSATAVGHYALATGLANVIPMFSRAVASLEFPRLARREPIGPAPWRLNLAGIVLGAGAVLLVAQFWIVDWLGSAHARVGVVLLPALLATALQGAYQLPNSWLLANGAGQRLRSLLLVVTGVNLVANLVLIPTGGAVGAALASAVSTGAYLVLALHHYRRMVAAGPAGATTEQGRG